MKITIIPNTATVIPPLVFAPAQNFAYPSGSAGSSIIIDANNPIVSNAGQALRNLVFGDTNISLVSFTMPLIGGKRLLITGSCVGTSGVLGSGLINLVPNLLIGGGTVVTTIVITAINLNFNDAFSFLLLPPSGYASGNVVCELKSGGIAAWTAISITSTLSIMEF